MNQTKTAPKEVRSFGAYFVSLFKQRDHRKISAAGGYLFFRCGKAKVGKTEQIRIAKVSAKVYN